jgi:predicted Zn-dependent protease
VTDALEVVRRALAAARTAAPDAELVVSGSTRRTAHTRFARNELTTSGDARDTRVDVSVAFGRRHASASTNQIDDASIAALARRALEMARLVPEDPELLPVLGPQRYREIGAAFDEATSRLEAAARAEMAARAIAAADAASLQLAGFVEHQA